MRKWVLAVLAAAVSSAPAFGHEAGGHRHDAPKAKTERKGQGPIAAGRFKMDAPLPGAAGAVSPLSHTDFRNDPEAFQFLIVSDNTGGARTGVFNHAVGKINLLQPEFVVSVGDLIEGYSESPDILAAQWAEFEAMVAKIEAPFFYTPGNHDYSNNVMADLWAKKFGPSFYHFTYRDVLFVVLNTERAHKGGHRPVIDAEQRAYLEKALKEHPKARWTFLFMHQPVWSIGQDSGWAETENVLAGRPFTAIAGHMHTYAHVSSNGRDLITLGTTGGSSQLRGEAYGEFDHVTWVTMGKDGPIIANIALDGITDKYVTAPGFAQTFEKIPTFAIEPWFRDAAGNPAGALKLTVTNPFDAAINFQIEAPQNPAIRLSGEALSASVAAKSTQSFTIPVAVEPGAGAQMRPLEVRAKAAMTLGDRPIAWSSVLRAAPVTRQTIGRTAQAVAFDGQVGEWGALRFAGQPPARDAEGKPFMPSAADASFRFDAAYDDQFLYVAIDVTDDEVTDGILSGKHDAQDLATFTFDLRPMAKSASNVALTTGMKAGDWAFIMAAPSAKGAQRLFENFSPASFESRMALRPGGYTAEYRVPIAYVQSKHPNGPWTDVRLNVSINDIDPKTKPQRAPLTLGWQPDWRAQISGTGIFERRTGE